MFLSNVENLEDTQLIPLIRKQRCMSEKPKKVTLHSSYYVTMGSHFFRVNLIVGAVYL